jgi:hypothetical protein
MQELPMDDTEYQQECARLTAAVLRRDYKEACLIRDRIKQAGRKAPTLGHDTESFGVNLMRRLHREMQAGVKDTSITAEEFQAAIEEEKRSGVRGEPGEN